MIEVNNSFYIFSNIFTKLKYEFVFYFSESFIIKYFYSTVQFFILNFDQFTSSLNFK